MASKRQDPDLKQMSAAQLRREIMRLRRAIRKHRDAKITHVVGITTSLWPAYYPKEPRQARCLGPSVRYLQTAGVTSVDNTAKSTALSRGESESLVTTKPEGKVSTGSVCRGINCGGVVVEHTSSRYAGDPMHAIMGPGSRNQYTVFTEYYCEKCGLTYKFPPPMKK